jgi:hypothetical protein
MISSLIRRKCSNKGVSNIEVYTPNHWLQVDVVWDKLAPRHHRPASCNGFSAASSVWGRCADLIEAD